MRVPVRGIKALAAVAAVALLAPAGASAAEKAPARPAVDPEKVVVADVNGTRITRADLEERLRAAPPAVRIRIRKNLKQFVEGLVQGELLYQEALRRGIDAEPALKRRLMRAKHRIVIDEFLRRGINKDVRVPEEKLRAFFEANKDRFRRKESVTLSHIVLKTEKEAWDALAEVRSGVPFAQVARERSIFEATRESGGVMGTAERGALEPKIEEAAFKLPIGQASEPIKTAIGWQVIRVNERTIAADARLEDVKDDVKLLYTEVKRREKYEKLIDSLRKKGRVQIFPDRLK